MKKENRKKKLLKKRTELAKKMNYAAHFNMPTNKLEKEYDKIVKKLGE